MKHFSAWYDTYKKIVTLQTFFFALMISIIYMVVTILLLNYHLLYATLLGGYEFSYKMNIVQSLIVGSWNFLPQQETILLIVNSMLTGCNLVLAITTIREMRHRGKIKMSIGGASIIGIMTTGCSSCGFSLLSLLGLSASVSFLPFHGLEIHIGAVILLLLSLSYMIFQLHKEEMCKIK